MKTEPASTEFFEWFKQEVERLVVVADLIIQLGEYHGQMLLVYPKQPGIDVQVIPVAQFFSSHLGKDIVTNLQKSLANDPDVRACTLISEVWVLAKENPTEEDKARTSIHDHPDRTEGVMFNCIGKGMQLLGMYKINRPENTLTFQRIFDGVTGADIETAEGVFKFEGGLSHGRMIIEPEEKN